MLADSLTPAINTETLSPSPKRCLLCHCLSLGVFCFPSLNWKKNTEGKKGLNLRMEHVGRWGIVVVIVHFWWGGFGSNWVFCFCAFVSLENPYGEHLCGTFGGGGGGVLLFAMLVSRWFRWCYYLWCVCCYSETCSCFSLLWWVEKRG